MLERHSEKGNAICIFTFVPTLTSPFTGARFLLEEGKLNLTLRLLVEFKNMQRNEMFAQVRGKLLVHGRVDPGGARGFAHLCFYRFSIYSPAAVTLSMYQALQKAQANEPGATFDDIPTIKIKAALFEQTLGVLLSCALSSIESLQTLDMPLLLEHMGRTLTFALTHSEMVRSPDSARRQEILCVHYMAYIFDNLDDLPEDRIMELICEHDLLSLLVRNVSLYHTYYSTATKRDAAKALSGLLAAEDFKTSPDKFLTQPDLKKLIVQTETDYVKVAWCRRVCMRRSRVGCGVCLCMA